MNAKRDTSWIPEDYKQYASLLTENVVLLESSNDTNKYIMDDKTFGQMTYKNGWYKKESIALFGKEYQINVKAHSFSSEKPITDKQRNSYKRFNDIRKALNTRISNSIIQYINSNYNEIHHNLDDAKKIEESSNLAGIVTPKILLFKDDGTTVLLMDCKWDTEHGIGVQIFPKFEVDIQDSFI